MSRAQARTALPQLGELPLRSFHECDEARHLLGEPRNLLVTAISRCVTAADQFASTPVG
jgi:hypothetical protein